MSARTAGQKSGKPLQGLSGGTDAFNPRLRHRWAALRAAHIQHLKYTPTHGVSVIAGDRRQMRRLPVRKIEQDFVDVTPAPPFRRIIALDNRVTGGVKMLGGVLVGRLVAAAHMAAGAADPQMQPAVTRFQALFAARSARNDVADASDMFAMGCHALLRSACNFKVTVAPEL